MSKKVIQPIHNKPKEIDPILKSLNVEKMNSSQVQEEIAKQEKILNNFISHYKYTEAETCDKKITALKKVLKQKKTKEIKQRHTAEKEHLKIDEFSDINNLNFYWDQKLQELQSRSQATLEELKRNQEIEYQQLLAKKDQETNIHPSAEFLKLQKEEDGLVKLRKFKEAEFIRKKKEEQRKLDMNKNGKNKEKSFNLMEKKLRQKHTNELLYLQNKFQAEFDELSKERLKQVESLNKKYSLKNKDLINQQKRETNITKNNNYGKRIEQLHNNYGQKFIIGQKEYAPQRQMEKVEQIYAELQDNKVEGLDIHDNNNLENENNAENGMNEDRNYGINQENIQVENNKNEENEN